MTLGDEQESGGDPSENRNSTQNPDMFIYDHRFDSFKVFVPFRVPASREPAGFQVGVVVKAPKLNNLIQVADFASVE